MSWQDRITDAVIETAAGDRFVFEFRDISKKRDERTEVFEFSDSQDYVQRKFSGSEVFDLAVWFSGENCDEQAEGFENATRDIRPLRFTHPLRKRTYLVQLMGLVRNDNLATRANEVAFSLSLHETIDLENIVKQENAARIVDNTINTLNLQNSDYFANRIVDKTPNALKKIKKGISTATAAVAKSALAYEYAADTLADFESIATAADALVETVDTNAKAMADVLQGYIEFSAKAIVYPIEKMAFYDEMIDLLYDLIADSDSDPDLVLLSGLSIISGLSLSSVLATENDYVTKTAVFAQSQKIYNTATALTVYIEDQELSGLAEFDPRQLETFNNLISLSAARLSQIAFKTKQERIFVLMKDEDLFPICYRLLGGDNPDDFDSKLLNLIEINKLGGKELYELKQGRRLKYYI